ncbi:ACT domain-containing protein [uncultured Anaerococcus sp.]|uniref:ACT domain-containing protein n=1 Tax=uncultured Anaerococcus sp. TaxID=293428 RepID=UPI00288A0DAF|nr:ACT domain-containing protein [uncultured Anaerococcus sp.]
MKAILTIIGKDRPGIIYQVTEVLYKYNINILDMSQTIMDDKFVAMINIDLSKANADFSEITANFDSLSKETKLEIRIQNEEVFDVMHRI